MSELYQDLEFGSLENEKKKLERTLDPGTYELMFSKWTYRESRSSEKPGINCEFKVINAENPDDNGFTVFHWCSWGSWFFNQATTAIFADRLSELNGLDPDSDEYESPSLAPKPRLRSSLRNGLTKLLETLAPRSRSSALFCSP